MQNNSSRNQDNTDNIICTLNFSWTPVIIGALVAIGLGFLLDLFSKGLGLSLYTTNTTGATVLAISAFVILLIGSIASMFTAGFAAGYFAGPLCGKKNYGFVYGFLAWALGLLLLAILSSNMAIATYIKANQLGGAYSSYTMNEIAATSRDVTTRVHPATDASDTAGEKNTRAVGLITFSMFILFFIGALSATMGGFTGFRCWDDWRTLERY